MERNKKTVLAGLDERIAFELGLLLKGAQPSRERAHQLNKLIQAWIRPYAWLHNQFILDFSNANISDTALFKLASRFRHLFINALQPPADIIETNFMHLTLYKLVRPKGARAKSGLGLAELLHVWRKTCHSRWGDKYEGFFEAVAAQEFELVASLKRSSAKCSRSKNRKAW